MKKWIYIAAFLLSAVVGVNVFLSMHPSRGAFVRFKTTKGVSYEHLEELATAVKTRLLADQRFVSAYAGPDHEKKRAMFHKDSSSWPLYGVKGTEFDGTAVSVDYIYGCLWISFTCRTTDKYSQKCRDLEELIASSLGEEMRSFTVSVEATPIFSRPGPGP